LVWQWRRPSIEPSLSDNLREIGQRPDAILARATSGDSKNALDSETKAACSLGIFGSPTFGIGEELFWGDDRLEDAITWYRKSDA
jgi:2-hydroxychromene-2-carboxylate isomerase